MLEKGLLKTEVQVLDRTGQWRVSPQVLDLGSGLALTFTPDVLEGAQPGLGPEGPTRRFTNARGDALQSRSRRVAAVKFAGRLWVDTLAAEAVWHEDYAPPLELGVIGWSLLERERVTIDVEKGELTLAPSQPGCAGIPVTVDGRGIVVQVEIGGRRIDAILDTAATGTITTDPNLADASPVRMGGREVEVGAIHHVDLRGLPAPVLVGVPFFRAQRVTIDLPARCLTLHPG